MQGTRRPHCRTQRNGPTTCLTYLGIEVDTEVGQLRLPGDKLKRKRALLQQWRARRTCTRKELESLIGLLNHACKVVRSGRSFLRRMIDLLHAVHRPTPPPPPPIPHCQFGSTESSKRTSTGGTYFWRSEMASPFSSHLPTCPRSA